MTFGEQANTLFCGRQEWSGRSKIDQLDVGRTGQDEILWLDVTVFLKYLGRKAKNVEVYSPMDISLIMAPVYGAYNLWCPPQEVRFRDFTVKRARFQHIPEGSTLDEVHYEV